MGALTGYASGLFMAGWAPDLTPSPDLLAVVGMATVLAGSVRAPLTGVVPIVEMTGQSGVLAPWCGKLLWRNAPGDFFDHLHYFNGHRQNHGIGWA